MTLGDMIKVISFRLGNRTGLESQITLEIKLAQQELEKAGDDLPWFLKLGDQALSVPAGQSKALPSGFLRMISVFKGTTEYDQGDRADMKLARAKGRKIYAIFDATLFLPDEDTDAVTLEIDYFKEASILETEAATNGWSLNAAGVLIAETGITVARFLRDEEAMGLFAQTLQRATGRLTEEITAREEAGRLRQMNKNA